MHEKTVIADALATIFDGISQLREAFPGRRFTIDGRLVGDIGEVIAAREFDIDLYDIQVPNHDGRTSDGRKVQIKATFKKSLTLTAIPDYYLGLKLSESGGHEVIYNGPGHIIARRYAHRKGIGEKQLSFPIAELRRLSDEVPTADRIPKRSREEDKS